MIKISRKFAIWDYLCKTKPKPKQSITNITLNSKTKCFTMTLDQHKYFYLLHSFDINTESSNQHKKAIKGNKAYILQKYFSNPSL